MYQELNVFIGGDLHANTATSLTPPEFNHPPADSSTPKEHKQYKFRAQGWEWFVRTLKAIFKDGHPDVAIWMGDLIEGLGERAESS